MLCVWMFSNIFGMVVEVKQMSTKDRLERKKYMGMWRWESKLTAGMMSRLPNTVIRYMERNNPNRSGYSSDSSASPRKRNSDTLVRFLGSMRWR